MGAVEALTALTQGKAARPPNEAASGCSEVQILYVARTSEIRMRAIEDLPIAPLSNQTVPSALI